LYAFWTVLNFSPDFLGSGMSLKLKLKVLESALQMTKKLKVIKTNEEKVS